MPEWGCDMGFVKRRHWAASASLGELASAHRELLRDAWGSSITMATQCLQEAWLCVQQLRERGLRLQADGSWRAV